MKRRGLLLLVVMIMALGANVGPTALKAGATSGTLVVAIQGFRNAAGHARVAVFNRAAGFPDDEAAAYRTVVTGISDGQAKARFDDLPLADYAVSMYHDENDDAKLNKGLFGVPREGYGVSNNVIHAMRAPTFEEARFRLDDLSNSLTVNVHY